MDSNPNDYTPVNLPVSGPAKFQPPSPNQSPKAATPTDRHLRRIFTKPWLLIMIGLILVIALFNAYSLFSKRLPSQPSVPTPVPQPSATLSESGQAEEATNGWLIARTPHYSFRYPPNGTIEQKNDSEYHSLSLELPDHGFTLTTNPLDNHNLYSQAPIIQDLTYNEIIWHHLTGIEYCDAGSCGPLAEVLQTQNDQYRFEIILNSFTPKDELLTQILSTFRFSDPSENPGEGG